MEPMKRKGSVREITQIQLIDQLQSHGQIDILGLRTPLSLLGLIILITSVMVIFFHLVL